MTTASFCSCPICGKPVPISPSEESEAAVCGYCGLKVRIQALYAARAPARNPPSERAPSGTPPTVVLARNPVRPAATVPALVAPHQAGAAPALPLESPLAPKPSGIIPLKPATPWASSVSGSRPAVAAESARTSARLLAQGKVSDSALVACARNALVERGWTCSSWAGRDAFAAEVRLPGARGDEEEVCNVTVSAMGGVLSLEAIAIVLPPPPWRTLREALNKLNICSRGPVFLLREYGVTLRTKLLAAPSDQEGLSEEKLLHALTRLVRDRAAALPILENTGGETSPRHVERAFAQATGAPAGASLSITQLQLLACSAGFHPQEHGNALFLNCGSAPDTQRQVRMLLDGDVLRGWAFPGKELRERRSSERHGFVRQVLGLERGTPAVLSPSQADTLLERLNALNEASGALHYVWSGEQILVMTIHTPALREMRVSTFRRFAEFLFRCARENSREVDNLQVARYNPSSSSRTAG